MSDLTPVQVEAKLVALTKEMYAAQKTLAEARDTETASEIDYKRARARMTLSTDCPKPTRGGYTTADKEAWIDEQVINEWVAYRVATTAREVAQDNLRVVLAVAETVRSLGASVRQAYSIAGAA
jgi:hypothetical protein